MKKSISILLFLSAFGLASSAFAFPVFVEGPVNPQDAVNLVQANYNEEPNAIDKLIGTGTDTYGLAKWMWGIMASLTGALMFGSFKFITWYEHRKYDRQKAQSTTKSDRMSRFVSENQVERAETKEEAPLPEPGKRRVIREGQPLFGSK